MKLVSPHVVNTDILHPKVGRIICISSILLVIVNLVLPGEEAEKPRKTWRDTAILRYYGWMRR